MSAEQNSLFDPPYGEILKRQGMEMAAMTRPGILTLAQNAAILLGRNQANVTIDDVHQWLMRRYDDYVPSLLGNASGSVFKGGERGGVWLFTGMWRKSTRYSSHRRYIKVWRLIERGPS